MRIVIIDRGVKVADVAELVSKLRSEEGDRMSFWLFKSEPNVISFQSLWDKLPADWTCPDCGVAKADFEMVEV